MNLQLRLETPADYRAVEELTREAFWINTDSNPYIVDRFGYFTVGHFNYFLSKG